MNAPGIRPLSLLLALACAQGLAAQTAPAVTETVSVRVMDLDVVVTDRDGRRVPDLRREEFGVEIDRKVVAIDYFAGISEGIVHAPDLSTLSPDLVLKQYEKGSDAYVPRHVLIFLDSGDLAPGDRRRVLDAVREFVLRLSPSDDALILSNDHRTRVLADWTSSKETLLAALDAAEKSGVGGLRKIERERQAMREIDSAGRRSFRISRAQMYQEEAYQDERRMVADLTDALSLLAGRPGKKIFFDVSGGFEFEPGSAMLAYAARAGLPPLSFRRDLSSEIKAFIDLANAMEITVFTADGRGLIAPGVDASNEPALAATSFFAREDSQTGLQRMADETGGRAILNQNDFDKGFGSVFADVSTYYSIGVNLKNVPADRPHRVDVIVDRPGLTVRSRRTYAVRQEEDRVQDRVNATLLTSTSFADFDLRLRIGPAKKEKGEFLLPLEIQIPSSDLTFAPESSPATLDYYVAAVNERGDRSGVSRVRQTVRAPAGTAAPTIVESVELRLKKGNYRIVVNARQDETGRMATARENVHVE